MSTLGNLWEEFGPDSPAEWDFDKVLDEEVIACCLWEYARESKTIGLKADLHWARVRHIWHREEYSSNPALKCEHDEEAVRIEERAKREGFDYDSFSDEWWKSDFPFMSIYDSLTSLVGDGARPWQRLPEPARGKLSSEVEKSLTLQPLSTATVGELEKLWNSNSASLLEVRSEVRSQNDDDSEEAALWEETVPVQPFASEEDLLQDRFTLALTLDFTRFTDQEIADAFVALLRAKRPPQWKQPRRVFPGARRKGRKLTEYRVALERLGLMRLLHFRSPGALREELPHAWAKIVRKEQVFRREIREACKFFRKSFPFLPKDEQPSSVDRFATWFAPVQKYMEEWEQEHGPVGCNK